jgi:hypothetical protein
MRTSETHSSAHVAPREAARALSVRRDGTTHADLTETSYRTLAADLAVTLDAVASLLRSVGVGVGPNASTYGLLSVAEHLDMGALMARRSSVDHDSQPQTITHLGPERSATADDLVGCRASGDGAPTRRPPAPAAANARQGERRR